MGKEKMTSLDRIFTACELKEPDMVPFILTSREFGIKYSGFTFSECLASVDKYVKSQIKCVKDFELDAVWDLWAIPVIAEALGSNLRVMEDDIPWITEPYAIASLDRIRSLKKLDVTKDGRIPYMLEVVKRLKKEAGGELPVIAWASPPFRTACMLRGIENLYKDIFRNPDLVEELLDLSLEYCTLYGKALIEAGADIISTSNPTANADSISRRHYQKFSFPYEKKLFDSLKEEGAKILYHTCGDWNDRYDLISETGVDILHTDKVDLKEFKRKFGKKVCIMGNVRSVSTMLQGNTKQVEDESLECMKSAAEKGGYILSADCALPRDTPPDNVLAMKNTVKKFGRYPIKL